MHTKAYFLMRINVNWESDFMPYFTVISFLRIYFRGKATNAPMRLIACKLYPRPHAIST